MKPSSVAALLCLVAVAHGVLYDGILNSTQGKTVTYSDLSVSTTKDDTSGASANNANSVLILKNVNITTSGATTNDDSSSFYGLNAGVLAANGATVVMDNVRIHTKGEGANGAFAYNTGANITIRNSEIICEGGYGHGVDSTYEGYVYVENTNIHTTGAHGAPLSNDRGGGTVVCKGGNMTATGQGSPGIYCTGTINVTSGHLVASNTEAVTIEGQNKVHLWDTYIEGICQGVKIYCSTSGDATAGHSAYSMVGGQLVLDAGSSTACLSDTSSFFYVDGKNGQTTTITLQGATLTSKETSTFPTLLYVIDSATVTLDAVSQTLEGNVLTVSGTTSVSLSTASSLYGHINKSSISVDSTSKWTNTRASSLTSINVLGTLKIRDAAAPLEVSGAATIGGSLVLGTGFTSGTYTLITASSISGSFSNVSIETSTLSANVTVGSTSVTVTITGTGGGSEASLLPDDSLPMTDDGSTTTGGGGGGMPGDMSGMPGGMSGMPGGMSGTIPDTSITGITSIAGDASGGAAVTSAVASTTAAVSSTPAAAPAAESSAAEVKNACATVVASVALYVVAAMRLF